MKKVEQDFSYGVVPLYREGRELKVLLVRQISYFDSANKFWILPKGHAEGSESGIEAAKRELREEAGVVDVEIVPEPTFTTSYSFVHEDVQIDKTVTYFIGWCASQETSVENQKEIEEVRWVSLSEAKELVTYQNSKDLLEQVEGFLNSTI
jgi:8-oxo-(d)GTP phosphatase